MYHVLVCGMDRAYCRKQSLSNVCHCLCVCVPSEFRSRHCHLARASQIYLSSKEFLLPPQKSGSGSPCMLQSGCSAAAALCAACHCHCQQLPGTFKLLQVLGGPVLQHVRHVAQAARQEVDATLETPESQISQLLHGPQQLPHTAEPKGGNGTSATPLKAQSRDAIQQRAVPAGVQEATLQLQQQQAPQHALVPPAAHQPPSPTGVKKTFYKRKLPCPPATEFSSSEGMSQSCEETHMMSYAHPGLSRAHKH